VLPVPSSHQPATHRQELHRTCAVAKKLNLRAAGRDTRRGAPPRSRLSPAPPLTTVPSPPTPTIATKTAVRSILPTRATLEQHATVPPPQPASTSTPALQDVGKSSQGPPDDVLQLQQTHCPPTLKDRSDWMFDRREFLKLSTQYGPFTLDAAADDNGYNAQCKEFCSPRNSFFDYNVKGHTIWMNPPFNQATKFLQHLLDHSDSSTSAVIVLPTWRHAPWQHLLSHFTALPNSHYSRGQTTLFTRPVNPGGAARETVGPIPWDVQVYHFSSSAKSTTERATKQSTSPALHSTPTATSKATRSTYLLRKNHRRHAPMATSAMSPADATRLPPRLVT
jgi:hypothetical protein